MEPFGASLSSDPDYWRNRTVHRMEEVVGSILLCFVIGPSTAVCCQYFASKSHDRAAIGKAKFYDSIHDISRLHDLRAEISLERSYICFIDTSETFQQHMTIQGLMPAPIQGIFQQPAVALPPNGGVPMMPQEYVQAPPRLFL